MAEEGGLDRPLYCLDGIAVEGCDFVDVGQVLQPGGVIPVTVKSLLFAGAGADVPGTGEHRLQADEPGQREADGYAGIAISTSDSVRG